MEPDTKKVVLIKHFHKIDFDDDKSKVSVNVNVEENRKILKFYFGVWRRRVKIKKDKLESVQLKLEQRKKLDNLMQTLKKYKKERENADNFNANLPPKQQTKSVSNYKNRYETQKTTIEKLTMKLEEKNRLIDELKLGILNKEALKSINEAKIEIREIFANCSVKVRCKIAPPLDYREKFMVSTQKAPKMLQKMEEKALERAKRREIILERKRIIEENRKRMIAEALEKKRVQDEEEKRRNLESIKERQRKELEMDKIRQTNKLIFMEKLNKAIVFYNRNLLRKSFKGLVDNLIESKMNNIKSIKHYKTKILTKAMDQWKGFIEDKYREKYAKADALFATKILSKTFNIWWEVINAENHLIVFLVMKAILFSIMCSLITRAEPELIKQMSGKKKLSVRSMQVAEDFYDLLLLNNTFVHWHRYVCKEFLERQKQMKLASNHYNRKVLFHYFYLWRSLPAVIQLEKAKEQKMKKWREKVWEILPNYKPPQDDD